jgi:hypothetical protein
MSVHNVDIKAEIGEPYKWWAICSTCGPLGWSYEYEEAEAIKDGHIG